MIFRHDFFLTELDLMENNGDIQIFTEWFLDHKMPLWFWGSSASSSGKYHPNFTKGEGGLVKHSKAVAQMAYELTRNSSFGFPTNDRHLIDCVLCAAILHDCAKYGITNKLNKRAYPKHDLNGSILIAKSWEEFFKTSCPKEITDPVLRHMGEWGTELPVTPADFVVHLADYVTSRKMIDCPEIIKNYDKIDAELPFIY